MPLLVRLPPMVLCALWDDAKETEEELLLLSTAALSETMVVP
jgi:hypothetical protein